MRLSKLDVNKLYRGIKVGLLTSTIKYRSLFVLAFVLILSTVFVDASHADNTLFTQASNMINDIKAQLLGMSAAAAGVGVGTGVFMKKFSMGKQDKIELGNKIIKDSIIGFVVLNSITYILGFVGGYTSDYKPTSTPTPTPTPTPTK